MTKKYWISAGKNVRYAINWENNSKFIQISISLPVKLKLSIGFIQSTTELKAISLLDII